MKCERGHTAAIHSECRFEPTSLPPIPSFHLSPPTPPASGSLQDARDAGEDDIEAILAEILNKEAKKTAVRVM